MFSYVIDTFLTVVIGRLVIEVAKIEGDRESQVIKFKRPPTAPCAVLYRNYQQIISNDK